MLVTQPQAQIVPFHTAVRRNSGISVRTIVPPRLSQKLVARALGNQIDWHLDPGSWLPHPFLPPGHYFIPSIGPYSATEASIEFRIADADLARAIDEDVKSLYEPIQRELTRGGRKVFKTDSGIALWAAFKHQQRVFWLQDIVCEVRWSDSTKKRSGTYTYRTVDCIEFDPIEPCGVIGADYRQKNQFVEPIDAREAYHWNDNHVLVLPSSPATDLAFWVRANVSVVRMKFDAPRGVYGQGSSHFRKFPYVVLLEQRGVHPVEGPLGSSGDWDVEFDLFDPGRMPQDRWNKMENVRIVELESLDDLFLAYVYSTAVGTLR